MLRVTNIVFLLLFLTAASFRGRGEKKYERDQTTTSSKVWGHPTEGFEYPTYEDFTLTLVEEFDQPIDLDTDPIWTWSDGGLTEGRARFRKEAISFPNGTMVLTASRCGEYSPPQPCSHANAGTYLGVKELTSGEVRTRSNMFRYGRYEVRMKAPTVQPDNYDINGNYIMAMFVYKDAAARHWREIDIEVTSGSPSVVTTNILYAENTSRWSPEIAAPAELELGTNTREDFHVYAFEWLPDKVTWFFDNKVIRTFTGTDLVPVPEIAGKIMMSLWIFGNDFSEGGYWFGGWNGWNNRYPMQATFDWFRYYKWDKDPNYPCENLAKTDCLTEDDLWLSGNNPCDGIIQRDAIHCNATCATLTGPDICSP